jgi:S1-C subfamily serine protease
MMATEYHIGNWPGVTFVIPADIVADSATGILETGKRERGWISGVGLGQDGEGILVEEVIPRSGAFAGCEGGFDSGHSSDYVRKKFGT